MSRDPWTLHALGKIAERLAQSDRSENRSTLMVWRPDELSEVPLDFDFIPPAPRVRACNRCHSEQCCCQSAVVVDDVLDGSANGILVVSTVEYRDRIYGQGGGQREGLGLSQPSDRSRGERMLHELRAVPFPFTVLPE